MHPAMLQSQNFDLWVKIVHILLESLYVVDLRTRPFLFCLSHHPMIDCVRVATFSIGDPEILHIGIRIYFVHLRVPVVFERVCSSAEREFV